MDVVCDPALGELFCKAVGRGLAGILGDHHAVYRNVHGVDVVDEAQDLHVVADAKVRAHFGFFNVARRDAEDDLGLVAQFMQQADLAVYVEAGQHPGGVVIVEQLAAELQIQLAAELVDASKDVFSLFADIKVVVESDLHG